MASYFYRCNHLSHEVFQLDTIPETHCPAPHPVQIEVTITIDLLIAHYDCLTGRFTSFKTAVLQETLSFDINILENHAQAREILGAMLRRLQLINPDSFAFINIIDDIIRHGFIIRNRASNRGRKVLPLRVQIRILVEKHVNNEEVLMRRTMAESASASNCGMVPAESSSMKKMLKRVRLEDGKKGEDCIICLEDIQVGSDASQMPCSHLFHGSCIRQWLEQSHYCPICRFEMPISES